MSRSISTSSSAGRRAPGVIVAVAIAIAMNASAFSWSKARPSSGLAFSAAMAASNAADRRASASGSRLIWVWHMPWRSIHRRTVRCARSFSWWRRPSSREMRRARSRTWRANTSTDAVVAACSTRLAACAANSTCSRSSSRLAARAMASARPADSVPSDNAAWTSGIAVQTAARSAITSARVMTAALPPSPTRPTDSPLAASTASSQRRTRCAPPPTTEARPSRTSSGRSR